MGVEAREQGAQNRRNNMEHDGNKSGRRCWKIDCLGGLGNFRYPQPLNYEFAIYRIQV